MRWGRALVLISGLTACAGRPSSPPVFAAASNVAPPPEAARADLAPPPTVEPTGHASPRAPAPTWAALYSAYFAPQAVGGCGRAAACHPDAMADADSAYEFLRMRGYLEGPHSALISPTNSCLRWFGGNMPPTGSPNPEAADAIAAWVAAGALHN